MKRWVCLLSLLMLWIGAHGVRAADAVPVMVYGKADRDVPAWTIRTVLPAGWTQDCCLYAQGIGVNEVLYKGEWTGEPDRVMVLNVWPSKLSSLEAEVQDDRHHYLDRDPRGKAGVFELGNKAMACRGVLYEGTDHKDDVVVFCDPGLASGIRFSWSMAFAHDEQGKDELLTLFRQVAEQSRYAVSSATRVDAAKAAH
ncbi:hypothetical protein [Dyella jiangningensis]|uniref:Uncharacterized protein n=1 Tax=Dyella jiangningensis TaxID=1379159 RepID=A0A328P3I0_9GAMM|nr:hypothetical protein [Dyella jiangningensis]RAO76788.1 hypothetical protein CA260_02400 [Dyella jiangningensis]